MTALCDGCPFGRTLQSFQRCVSKVTSGRQQQHAWGCTPQDRHPPQGLHEKLQGAMPIMLELVCLCFGMLPKTGCHCQRETGTLTWELPNDLIKR